MPWLINSGRSLLMHPAAAGGGARARCPGVAHVRMHAAETDRSLLRKDMYLPSVALFGHPSQLRPLGLEVGRRAIVGAAGA